MPILKSFFSVLITQIDTDIRIRIRIHKYGTVTRYRHTGHSITSKLLHVLWSTVKENCKHTHRDRMKEVYSSPFCVSPCMLKFIYISEIANFISEFNGNHPMPALFHQCCYRETILPLRYFFFVVIVVECLQLLLFCLHLNRSRWDTNELIAGSHKTQCFTTTIWLTVWNDFHI